MIFIIYIAILEFVLWRVLMKKSIFDLVLIFVLLVPDLWRIEASNYMMVFLCVLIIVFHRKKILLTKRILLYVLGLLVITVITLLSWMFINGTNAGQAFKGSFGIVRYPIIVICLYLYEAQVGSEVEEFIEKLYYVITVTNVLNLVACIYQKINPLVSLNVFGESYSYSFFWVSEIKRMGNYTRVFGLWESPMSLGIMALLWICLLINKIYRQKKFLHANIICSVILGTLSLTKSFFLGMAVLIVLYYGVFFHKMGKRKFYSLKTLVSFMSYILAIPLGAMCLNRIYYWSMRNAPYLAYYLGYLWNPFSAFDSRFSNTGTLADTIIVIKNHIICGVGMVPLSGELVGDNSYIVLLHGGGIVALGICMLIFGSWLFFSASHKDWNTFIFLLIWMLCGMSLPVLINYKICTIPIIYFLFIASRGGENQYENTSKKNGYVYEMVSDNIS